MSNLLDQHIRMRLSHDILQSVHVVQGDSGRELYFVFDDYELQDDVEYRIYIRKPSGKEIYNYCYYANEELVVQLTPQMIAEVGESFSQIQIIQNHVELTSFTFTLIVEESLIYSSSIDSKDEFNILDELIDNARIAINQMNSITETVTEQEEQRVENESERQSAEEDRVSAESSRVQEFNEMKSEFDLLKSESETATSNANQATQNANTATDAANDAAELAQDKAQSAETAANTANTAAESAATATQSANSAAELAQSKAQDAESAADNANSIAQDLQQKLSDGDFSASVDVGTVTTGEPGTSVVITNSGTTKDAVFNFVIPRGATGSIENLDTATVEFSEASNRANLNSGETISTILGKIQKYFSDLGTLAFYDTGQIASLIPYPKLNSVEIISLNNLFNNNIPSTLSVTGNMKVVTIGLNMSPYIVRLVSFSIQFTTSSVPSNYQIDLPNISSSYALDFNTIVPPVIRLSCANTSDGGYIEFTQSGNYVYGIIHLTRDASTSYRYSGHGTWITDS